jgi:hypothetical protein
MSEKFKPMREEPEKREEVRQIPKFLYEENGRLITGMQGDSDVTREYEDFLKSTGRKADNLPSFLYDESGTIYMGSIDDSDVTEEWERWVKTLKPASVDEKE